MRTKFKRVFVAPLYRRIPDTGQYADAQDILGYQKRMTIGQISMLESGARPNPGFLTIAKLAQGLGVSLDQLGASALGGKTNTLRTAVERDSLRILNELDLVANEAERLAARIRTLAQSKE